MHDLSKSQLSYRKNCLLSFFPPPPPPTFLNSFDFATLDFFCHPNPPPPPRFLIRSPFPLWTSENMSQGWHYILYLQRQHIMYACTNVPALLHTQTQAHRRAHTHTYPHTHTHTHTHTHAHTHVHTPGTGVCDCVETLTDYS